MNARSLCEPARTLLKEQHGAHKRCLIGALFSRHPPRAPPLSTAQLWMLILPAP
jgi:hypothetical protein